MNALDEHRYDDILALPHKQSAVRPHLSMAQRAAQFSPFAALAGYDDSIRETARTTEPRTELDDGEKEILRARLSTLAQALAQHPRGQIDGIAVRYFVPDPRKEGGAYVTRTAAVKKVDDAEQLLLLQDGTRIPLADILALSGAFFGALEAPE